MNHKQMNAELADLAGELHLYCWINAGEKFQNTRGWVDAVILGHAGALFIENKTEDGRRTRAQERVARLLLDAGLAYRLYHPADYDNGTVRTDLENIT